MKFSSRSLRFSRSAVVMTALVFAGGCAGGHTIGTSITTNPAFVGTWTGPYSVAGTSDNGTATLIIGSSGSFTGNGHDNLANVDFSINGSINESGDITLTASGGETGTGTGTWAITSSGHLAGAASNTTSGTTVTANYDLTKTA